MEEKKTGFLGSKAFKLILVWLALGGVLSGLFGLFGYVGPASKKMLHQCEAWAEQYGIHEEEGHHGGEHDICHLVAVSEKAPSFTRNLAASFSGIAGKMRGATAWALPNFLILLTLLWHFAKDPVNEGMKQRREELAKAIEEAEKARAEAEALKAEYEKRLAEIDKEIERLRQEMREQAEKEKARLLAEAENQAKRIQNEAEFTARQELLVAQYRLREEAARLAVEVAERVLKEVMNQEDRARLLDEYINNILSEMKS